MADSKKGQLHNYQRRQRRLGLSLLETILAIGLSVIVLLLISSAIRLQIRMLDVKRTSVEEGQLARSLLRMISDDLRSAVYVSPEANDSSSLGSSSGGSALGATTSGSSTTGGTPSTSTTSSSTQSSSETSSDTGDDVMIPEIRGIFGDAFQLQVDVHRTPRIDEFLAFGYSTDDTQIVDPLSGVKTVIYGLQTDSGPSGMTTGSSSVSLDSMSSGLSESGLYRRSFDRAVTSFAQQSGTDDGLNLAARLMAPEVRHLSFQYSDGYGWYDEWDSDSNGGLPMAVRVLLVIASTRQDDELSITGGELQINQNDLSVTTSGDQVYQVVVSIPTARPIDLQTLDTTGGL